MQDNDGQEPISGVALTLASLGAIGVVTGTPLGTLCLIGAGVVCAWRWHKQGITQAATQATRTVQALPAKARAIGNATQGLASSLHTAATGTTPATATNSTSADTSNDASPSNDLLGLLASRVHLVLVGSTGGGKSVILHNLARVLSDSGADVLMIDADSIAGTYPGYTCIGAGDDYDAIAASLQGVAALIAERRQQRKMGVRSFSPAWLFIDEAQDVFSECEGSRELFFALAKRGRKLNIHVVLGTQDTQVKTLGIEGQSQVLRNLEMVQVATKDGVRQATIAGATIPVPTMQAPDDMVHIVQDASHAATGVTGTATGIPAVATGMDTGTTGIDTGIDTDGIPDTSADTGNDASHAATGMATDASSSDSADTGTDASLDAEIRLLSLRGTSKNAIMSALKLKGSKQQRLARIAQALQADNDASTPGDNDDLLLRLLGDRTE